MLFSLISLIACDVLRLDQFTTLPDGTKVAVVVYDGLNGCPETFTLLKNSNPENQLGWYETTVYKLDNHGVDGSGLIKPSPLSDGKTTYYLALPDKIDTNDNIAFRTYNGKQELYTKPWTLDNSGTFVPTRSFEQENILNPAANVNEGRSKNNGTKNSKDDATSADGKSKNSSDKKNANNKKNAKKDAKKGTNAAPIIIGVSIIVVAVSALLFAC